MAGIINLKALQNKRQETASKLKQVLLAASYNSKTL